MGRVWPLERVLLANPMQAFGMFNISVEMAGRNSKPATESDAGEEASSVPDASTLQMTMNSIRAALAVNQMSPGDGYDAFDEDKDGKVSLADLQAASKQFNLNLDPSAVAELYKFLDPREEGAADKEVWRKAMSGASTEDTPEGVAPESGQTEGEERHGSGDSKR